MIELTWVSDAFKAVGALYWLLAIGALITAWKFGKSRIGRAMAIIAVLALFGYLPVTSGIRTHKANQFRAEAFGRFNKYCAENAGEKFYKKVKGGESVFIMRPREPYKLTDLTDQYWRGDPYAAIGDRAGDGEIIGLLEQDRSNSVTSDVRLGFRFVEIERHSSTGNRELLEYTARQKDNQRLDLGYELNSRVIEKRRSRYGFTWEDISTDDDRKYWIAGSRLTVVDLETKETVSERVGYMIDPGFGSTNKGRTPWPIAINQSCPRMEFGMHYSQTRRFVIRALNLSQKGE